MNYSEFVKSRAKTGIQILMDLSIPTRDETFRNMQLLHASLGMMSELAELSEAGSVKNTLEELGDFWFYLEHARETLGIERPSLFGHAMPTQTTIAIICLLASTGKFADAVKGLVIYGKPYKSGGLEILLTSVYRDIDIIVKSCGFTMADVEAANVEKLQKRYPNGYSNADAQARADKVNNCTNTENCQHCGVSNPPTECDVQMEYCKAHQCYYDRKFGCEDCRA